MPRPRRRAASVRAKLSLDPKSVADFQRKLKDLEKVIRQAVEEDALMAGAQVIHDEAEKRAPGPYIEIEILSKGQLSKVSKVGASMSSASRVAAIGPDKEHWYYRFPEFGATPHDIAGSPVLAFQGDQGDVVTPFVHSAGGMPARPFMRPAEAKADEARKAMADVLLAEIEKVTRS